MNELKSLCTIMLRLIDWNWHLETGSKWQLYIHCQGHIYTPELHNWHACSESIRVNLLSASASKPSVLLFSPLAFIQFSYQIADFLPPLEYPSYFYPSCWSLTYRRDTVWRDSINVSLISPAQVNGWLHHTWLMFSHGNCSSVWKSHYWESVC